MSKGNPLRKEITLVVVEYDVEVRGGTGQVWTKIVRRRRVFECNGKARAFWTHKFRAGKNPKVVQAEVS